MKDDKEEVIETPNLDSAEVETIHPALDFQDKGYLGVWLPTNENGDERLFLVSSDREVISAQKKTLQTKKLRLKEAGGKSPFQWSPSSIKEFKGCTNSIDPKELFNHKVSVYNAYVDYPREEISKFKALWTMGTFLFPIFKSYPYVYLGGVKQTGKTKALNVSALLSFNPIMSASVSSSALFRLIQEARCCLFIDETEKLNNPERAMDFRALLLQGYKKGGVVQRVEKNSKDNFVVKNFEVYSPKMLANIGGLEDVMDDRCIKITMLRTINKDIGNREIDESNPEWQELRDKNCVFAMENWYEIKEIYDNLPNETELSNRNWELWHPILAIASFIDKKLYDEMRHFAVELSEQKKVENATETAEYVLMQLLVKLAEGKTSFYPVKELRTLMIGEFGDEPWLNEKWLGRALGRLGFSEKRRVGTGIEYQLSPAKVKDIAIRLGVLDQNAYTQTTLTTQTTPVSVVNEVNVVSEDANDKECCKCGSKDNLAEIKDDIDGKTLWICPRCAKK